MAAVAIGQFGRSAAAAEQQELLALGAQGQRLVAVGRAVRHCGGMPAAAQTMGFTGLDQANVRDNWEGISGHGWACVARMKSGLWCAGNFPGLHPG